MRRGLVIGGRRVRFRFFVFLFLLVCGIAFILKHQSFSPSYAAIEYGNVKVIDKGKALIIRQEAVYEAPDYERIIYHVAEGDRVKKGDLLATLYRTGYKEEDVERLYDVQQKIVAYQQENIVKDLIDRDLEKIDEEISIAIREIQTQVRDGKLKGLDKKEKHLRSLLSIRQEMMDKKAVPDDYLKRLYLEEAKLKKKLDEWVVEIIAPEGGIVSFYIDGLEKLLNLRSVDYMTPDDFTQLIKWEPSAASTEVPGVDRPFFRLIDPAKWYVACEVENKEVYYDSGDEVEVKFLGEQEEILKGKVYRTIRGRSSTLVIVEPEGDPGPFINTRKVQVEIIKNFEGLRVPEEAIIERHGSKGVVVLYRGSPVFVEVKVKAAGGGYAIIEKKGDIEGLELHGQVRVYKN